MNQTKKKSSCLLLAAASVLGAAFLNAEALPDGFTALFNGTDLRGWHGDNPHVTRKGADRDASLKEQAQIFADSWAVDNGEMVNTGEGPYATTDRAYGDFELRIEYKLSPGADSGIYLRGSPQVQIWDTTEAGKKWRYGAQKGSGGLWNNPANSPGRMPLVHADRPLGEWNHMRIRLIGSRTWIWLNDQLVVNGALFQNYWEKKMAPLPARGEIHLQTHGGEMRWRNICIREIGAEEANQVLRAIDSEGFVALFNGEDFSGWQGALDQYTIVDGAIVSQGGGNIFTKKKYSDLVWKMEFKLPPGGNNGLALRYSGSGNPAYEGLCELQVLENTAPQYAKLDPRQYHGSVYGKVAARRGYQREVNAWNYQLVRVQGSRIYVELNGNILVDADLATVTAFMSPKFKSEIPEEGYFGFAGHGKGVAFRNLLVRDLRAP